MSRRMRAMIGASRSARAAILTLAQLEDDGYLEQLEQSGRLRPVPR
jgi:hypothetical protein